MKKRTTRRAQSGMEYLITYGWAILIVGIVVLLLLSLRVLDVDWWSVTNTVYMLSAFSIPDFKATPGSTPTTSVMIFQLINERGTNVTVHSLKVNGMDVGSPWGDLTVYHCPLLGSCTLNTTTFPFNMTPGMRFILNGTVNLTGDVNTVFTTVVQVNYTSPRSGLDHLDTGMMRGRIEPV